MNNTHRRPGRGFRHQWLARCCPCLSSSAERADRPAALHVSGVARLFPDHASSPFRPEQVAPLRIFFVEIDGVDDAVGPKAAKIAAQLAPCRQYPHGFVITDGDRPDMAFAVAAMFVAITQADFLAFVNLRAGPRHVDAVRLLAPLR